ncbi:SPOSA6832_03595 [Sporobolomyces salmonicolor]|uniref:SPOSA6832_03595-mRNA-1:cds n=1 Tax=Sporidiobolus salmonicolor TaxID=5005 RepID=A0A0D6EPI1_SPOSA|nr:SPOSA6832_03595 [Sporobolomyces salmonicolor]
MTESPSISPPPCLSLPSREAFFNVVAALHDRELQRRRLSAPRSKAAAAALGHALNEVKRPRDAASACRPESWFKAEAGTARGNTSKNRYGDIICYDRTRVLPPFPATAASDEPPYVNASLVREPDLGFPESEVPRRWWIAAQAPIPTTVHDFLSLLLAYPTSHAFGSSTSPCPPALPLVSLIVQLTPLVEGRREKCHPYFPSEPGEEWELPSGTERPGEGIWIRLESKDERDGARTSELSVGREGDEAGRRVTHVEYLGWRDHGVPESPLHLLRFIQRMNTLNASLSSSVTPAPILLHCSAGVGRTGTYITISSLLPVLSCLRNSPSTLPPPPPTLDHPLAPYPAKKTIAGTVDYVGWTIDGLRDQRTTMVQTTEQILWVFKALVVAWENGVV